MLKWLENAVFYEIYPTSFCDANGDGIGDLKGITDKVSYLKSLGIDAVWFNPFYKSPFKDGGYDIADYYEIDKHFGTMEDFDNMVKVFKQNGIKIIMDLVIGHTSDKHKWFKMSARAKKNKYYDYYVWTDSLFTDYPGSIKGLYLRDGGYVPNYYASQPALNFGFEQLDPNAPWKLHYTDPRLKPLREEILNIMRFYLDKGIDGFRVDMAGHLIKEAQTFNETMYYDDYDKGTSGIQWFWNTVLSTIRSEYSDKVFIAEWDIPQLAIPKCGFDMDFLTHDTFMFNDLYKNEKGNNLTPYFERGDNYFSVIGKGTVKNFIEYTEYLYKKLGDKGMFTAPTGTHDEIRMPTLKSTDIIKCIFAHLLTMKQVPMIYYGDEIGMVHNRNISKDGGGVRTGARTPMQWTEGKNRGFSTLVDKDLYLPVDDVAGRSVEAQEKDENSLLNTVKALIKIKKSHTALNVSSTQETVYIEDGGFPYIYRRKSDDESILVAINPSSEPKKVTIKGEVLLGHNYTKDGDQVSLNGTSFVIVKE